MAEASEDPISIEEKQECIARAKSAAFQRTVSIDVKRRLLQILAEDWLQNRQTGRQHDQFDKIKESTVRTRLAEMRSSLTSYFLKTGGSWFFSIDYHPEIRLKFERWTPQAAQAAFDSSRRRVVNSTPSGEARTYTRRQKETVAPDDRALAQFWSPFLIDLDIVYAEVHFFYQRDRRLFIRFQDYNGPDDQLSPKDLAAEGLEGFDNKIETLIRNHHPFLENDQQGQHWLRLPRLRGEETARRLLLKDIRYYVTRGHMKFVVRVTRQLTLLGGDLIYTRPAHEAKHVGHRKNVIHLGNLRTNPFVRESVALTSNHSVQNYPFRIGPDAIFDRSTKKWKDFTPVKDQPNLTRVYGLITRMPAKTGGEALIVAANHSAVYTAIANHLTSGAALRKLSEELGTKELPNRFQVVVAVDIDSVEERIPGTKELIMPKIVSFHVPESADGTHA